MLVVKYYVALMKISLIWAHGYWLILICDDYNSSALMHIRWIIVVPVNIIVYD